MLLIFGGIVVLFSLLAGHFIFSMLFPFGDIPFYPWGIMTIFTAVFNGFLKTYSSLLINQQKLTRFFWINVLNFFFTIVMSLVLIKAYPNSLNGPIIGRLVPAVISFFTIIYFVIKENKLSYSSELLRSIRSFCPPLFFYSIFIWIITYIDRYILKMFLTDATFVGIFDFAVKCALVIEIIQVGIINAIHPRVYTIWKDNNIRESTPEVNKYYHSFTALSLLLIPIFILIIPILVPYIIKKEIYYESFTYLPIICVGFATRGLFNLFLAPIFFFKKTSVLPKIYVFIAGIQIIMTYFLVKYFGLIGAAWSSFVVKIIQIIFLYFESKKIFNFNFNILKLVYLPLIYVLIVIISNFMLESSNPISVKVFQCIVSYSIVFLVFKRELKQLWCLWRNKYFKGNDI
jgi:O-antigen/teichoic acid export membrane protein